MRSQQILAALKKKVHLGGKGNANEGEEKGENVIATKLLAQKDACKDENKNGHGKNDDGRVSEGNVSYGRVAEKETCATGNTSQKHPQTPPPVVLAEPGLF